MHSSRKRICIALDSWYNSLLALWIIFSRYRAKACTSYSGKLINEMEKMFASGGRKVLRTAATKKNWQIFARVFRIIICLSSTLFSWYRTFSVLAQRSTYSEKFHILRTYFQCRESLHLFWHISFICTPREATSVLNRRSIRTDILLCT